MGDGEYTNIEEDSPAVQATIPSAEPPSEAPRSTAPVAGSTGDAPSGGGTQKAPNTTGVTSGEGDMSSSGGGNNGAGATPDSGESGAGDMSSSGGGGQGGGESGGGDEGGGNDGGDGDNSGGQGPDRRGGGGQGSGGSGDQSSSGGGGNGSGGGTGGSGDQSSSGGGGNGGGAGEEQIELTVKLRAANGRIFFPRYRFAKGNGELILSERRFTPGLYTLIVSKKYLRSGREEVADQAFAWGVLSLNTNQDRYRPGETSHIAIGVLDELGAIVCDADLELSITNPNGVVTTVSTNGGGISVTGTCGYKKAGFIIPDYETFVSMNIEGAYHLELTANNLLGSSHKLTSDVQVVASPPYIIHRAAATRLWPFAPSPMTIEVEFLTDFSGTITDVVPDGFGITDSSPHAETALIPSTRELTLSWTGSWSAGETARFWYEYDAPDISPEFYLVGPLILDCHGEHCRTMTNTASPFDRAQDDTVFYELRQWQIANDNEGESANYTIPRDVMGAGGGELALSTNYKLSDTIGEAVIGFARSALYSLQSGYRHTDDSYISLGCDDLVDLGSLVGEGQLTGNINCTVTADGAGYSLSWHGGAPDYSLVGHWKLDETSGTTAYDLSGNGNNATHYGSPVISSLVPTKHFSTRSVEFDTDGDYLDTGSSTQYAFGTGDFTLSIWINPDDFGDYQHMFAWDGSQSTGAFKANKDVGDGKEGWVYWYDTSYSTYPDIAAPLQLNTWNHVVLVRRSNVATIYLDGVAKGTDAGFNSNLTGTPFMRFGNGWSGEYTDGHLDEARMYNRALSTGEILQLASTGPSASMVSAELNTIPAMEFPSTGGLVGHWKLDEIAGTVAADSSGNGNDGAHTSVTISTSLPSGINVSNYRSVQLGGSANYIDVGTNSSLDVGGSDHTVSLWASWTETTGNARALLDFGAFTDKLSINTGYLAAGQDKISYGVGTNTYLYNAGSGLNDGEWHHIAARRSGSEYKIYIDGVDTAYSTGTMSHITQNRIGNGAHGDFNGKIDDVRVYNKALTAAEIKALAAQTQTWNIPTTSAYWGGRLSSTSTDTDNKWGTDSSSEKWLAVGDGDYTIVTRTGRTGVGGSTETFQFRAEVGSDIIQAPGTYKGTVTLTATAL